MKKTGKVWELTKGDILMSKRLGRRRGALSVKEILLNEGHQQLRLTGR